MEKGRINKNATALEFRLAEKLQESRHFIEQVANSTPDIIYVLDLDRSKIIYANRRLYDLLGLNHNLVDIHPDDIVFRTHQLEASRFMQDEETSEIEIRLRALNDSWRWFRIRDTVFKRKNGVPSHLIGIAQDIHEEKEREEELRFSKFFNDKIISAIPGMLYVIDLDKRKVVYVSEHVREILGLEPKEVYSKGALLFPEICHPDDLKSREEYVNACRSLEGDEHKILELRLRIADGTYNWFRFRDKAFKRDANGNVIEMIGIVTNIEKENPAKRNDGV